MRVVAETYWRNAPIEFTTTLLEKEPESARVATILLCPFFFCFLASALSSSRFLVHFCNTAVLHLLFERIFFAANLGSLSIFSAVFGS